MKLALKILGTLVAVVFVAVFALLYFFGPTYGSALLGKPIFLFNASEERINKAMLETAAARGIYASSEEFQRAYEAAAADLSSRERLADAIDAAGGKHSHIYSTAEESDRSSPTSPHVKVKDGAIWATVPGVGRTEDGQAYADVLARGITQARSACAAVVDLRGNGGGDMGPMIAGLTPLLPDGPVLTFAAPAFSSDVVVDGNGVTGGGTPIVTSGGKLDVPVAVLVDDQTASSGEATMLAFRGLDSSRSFGTPTAGYASANMVIDYPDGRSLMLTTAKDKARTGEEFAEDPIQPDAPLSELQGWLDERCG